MITRSALIRGFDYRTRTPLEQPLKSVRQAIAKAREAGQFARLAGDAVIFERDREGTLVPAVEYYDQERAR